MAQRNTTEFDFSRFSCINNEFFFTLTGPDNNNHPMKNFTIIALTIVIFTLFSYHGGGSNSMAPAIMAVAADAAEGEMPLSFKNVIGTWSLMYSGNYGYAFSLSHSYRATVILYLNMEILTFRGVYTIEEGNKLRININEMREEHRGGGKNRGFVKAKSSYFLFGGYKTKKGGRETLYLKPLAIIIDGNNSEGYFEPLIKLAKS